VKSCLCFHLISQYRGSNYPGPCAWAPPNSGTKGTSQIAVILSCYHGRFADDPALPFLPLTHCDTDNDSHRSSPQYSSMLQIIGPLRLGLHSARYGPVRQATGCRSLTHSSSLGSACGIISEVPPPHSPHLKSPIDNPPPEDRADHPTFCNYTGMSTGLWGLYNLLWGLLKSPQPPYYYSSISKTASP
jgi:hypothetical protein